MKRGCSAFAWWFGAMAVFFGLQAVVQSTYQFSAEDVRPQLERVLGTSEYTILDQSNNALVVGSPDNVTYNIQLPDSSVVSCVCTDGLWQPRICRKYQ